MRRLRYNVATSLDGFIARQNGEYDWIVMDPAIDFAAIFAQFDTLVMGRRTFELVQRVGSGAPNPGMKTVVASRTLRPEDHPGVTILGDHVAEAVAGMKEQPGKDMWLFGGGDLLRSLLDAGVVDTIEIALMPVMIGSGIPVLMPGRDSPALRLVSHKAMPSGIVMLAYEVKGSKGS